MTIEGRQRFPVRVRYAPEYRADPQALGDVLVASPDGAQVPLGQVARIEHARGPAMISSENGLLLATVLLNVQGRDVGGFVEEAQRGRRARRGAAGRATTSAGAAAGRTRSARGSGCRSCVPIVLLVIFVLLYFTYHSALEAAHVLLAVPFALTGGVYLLWLLGYNFSVAVWVGFIALFGTAVQTGVVMVIYLEEAVERKRRELGGTLTRAALREAVMEGALLRLRPKVMTVSTVVAGLLPIMWSTRVGAEVMKPLATPVLGGMVSSLLHVLIVTPVIFFWMRERRLGLQHETLPRDRAANRGVAAVIAMAAADRSPLARTDLRSACGGLGLRGSCGRRRTQRRRASFKRFAPAISTSCCCRRPARCGKGGTRFTIEFRRSGTATLVDVGTVRASANMPMPGMVMSGGLQVTPTGRAGRYNATAEFGMAGAWQMAIEWNGPAGQGSVNFEGGVQ